MPDCWKLKASHAALILKLLVAVLGTSCFLELLKLLPLDCGQAVSAALCSQAIA